VGNKVIQVPFAKTALVVGVALVLIRFLSLGNSPFVADEPMFIEMASAWLKGGSFPFTGMSGSSLPIPYGAGAIWFYAISQWLSPESIFFVYLHTTAFSLGFLFLFLAVRRIYGTAVASWTLMFASSSPFLFFFSRHPWDTTLFVPITAGCLYLLAILATEKPGQSKSQKLIQLIFLGLLIAYAINIQLASGPFVVTVTAVLAYLLYKSKSTWRERLFYFSIYSLTIALAIAPYLFEAYRLIAAGQVVAPEKTFERWGNFRHLWWNFLYSGIGVSVWKGKHFFEPGHEDFYSHAGSVAGLFFRMDFFGWVTKAFSWAFLIWGLVQILRGRLASLNVLEISASAGFLFILLLFQYLNIPVRPHYFQSFWWLPFLGLAIALTSLSGVWQKILIGFGAATVFVNAAFLIASLSFLSANAGTRGMHHGTGAGEVRDAVKRLCLKMESVGKTKASLDLSQVYTQPNPVNFFLNRVPECKKLELQVGRGLTANADYAFAYDQGSKTDARLLLVPLKSD
jgi:hypothetical protein